MQRSRIQLDTMTDVTSFLEAVQSINTPIFLSNGRDLRVSAKSLLGVLYTFEWDELYVESEIDLGEAISKFRKA